MRKPNSKLSLTKQFNQSELQQSLHRNSKKENYTSGIANMVGAGIVDLEFSFESACSVG